MFACLIWYSIFTVLFAWATTSGMMFFLRLMVGIGLGAQWGVGNTLVAECLPARLRIMCSAVIQTGFAFGPMLSAWAGRLILPNYGWRPLFYIGAIGIIAAVLMITIIAEPQAWYESREKAKETGTKVGNAGKLFSREIYSETGISYLRTTVCLFVLVFGTLLAYWSSMSWIPNWLVAERGMDIVKSMNYLMVLNTGGIIGYIVFAYIADRFGRKKPALAALILSVFAVIIYVSIKDPSQMLIYAPIYSFLTYPIFGLYGGYMSECYPTDIRATGVNGIYNLGRIASFVGPYILGALAAVTSFTFAIGASAALYLISVVPLLFLPETFKGKISKPV
jgi:MFS family permease